jgi:hypothetical protein
MAAPKGRGIADDSAEYESLEKEPTERERRSSSGSKKGAPPAAPSKGTTKGIADDAKLFEDLMTEETTGKARTLDSDWLYQKGGQVFGPLKPRDLLELLYSGEIDKDTPIALDGTDFEALHKYGVFRVHLPKVKKHQDELAAAKVEEEEAARARLRRRIGWSVFALLLGAGATYGGYRLVWMQKEKRAEEEKRAKEAALMGEIDKLMASVNIEPPLIGLGEEPEDTKETTGKPKRRRAVARFTSGASGNSDSTELTRPEIMAGIAKAFGGFKRCIVEQIQRDADSVPEQINLSFTINNDGAVQGASLNDRTLRDSLLAGCMSKQLALIRFRKYKGEVQNVEYPITIGRR